MFCFFVTAADLFRCPLRARSSGQRLECDEDKATFEAKLGKLAKANPVAKSKAEDG
jgi:hypothetical protein